MRIPRRCGPGSLVRGERLQVCGRMSWGLGPSIALEGSDDLICDLAMARSRRAFGVIECMGKRFVYRAFRHTKHVRGGEVALAATDA